MKGDNLVITIPTKEEISKSGKSIVIASSNGNVTTDLKVKGKLLVVGVNAYIKKD